MTQRVYTTYQVAELLGTTPGVVFEWMQKGWLEFHRLGDRSIRISQRQLIDFLRRQGVDIESILAKAGIRPGQQTMAGAASELHQPPARKLALPPQPPSSYEPVEPDESPVAQGCDDGKEEASDAAAAPEPPSHAATQASPDRLPERPPQESAPDAYDETGNAGQQPDLSQSAAHVTPASPGRQVIDAVIADALRRRASHVVLERQGAALRLWLNIDGVLHAKQAFHRRLPGELAQPVMAQLLAMAGLGEEQAARGSFQLWHAGSQNGVARLSHVPLDDGGRVTLELPAEPMTLDELMTGGPAKVLRGMLAGHGLVVVAAPARDRSAILACIAADVAAGRPTLCLGLDAMSVGQARRVWGSGQRDDSLIELLRQCRAEVAIIERLEGPACAAEAIRLAGEGALVAAGIDAPDAQVALEMLSHAGQWPLAAVLRGFVQARLVRRLCDECKRPAGPAEINALNEVRLGRLPGRAFAPGLCARCGRSGYVGQLALTAAWAAHEPLARLLRGGQASADDSSSPLAGTLAQAAVELLDQGLTSPEEIAGVLKPGRPGVT